MSQVISIKYPASVRPAAFLGGLVLLIGLVAVVGFGLAARSEPVAAPAAVGGVSALPVPLESEYLRSISATWGATPLNAPVPLESEYLRSISATWGATPLNAPVPLESEYLRSISAGWGGAPAMPLESEYLRGIAAGW